MNVIGDAGNRAGRMGESEGIGQDGSDDLDVSRSAFLTGYEAEDQMMGIEVGAVTGGGEVTHSFEG